MEYLKFFVVISFASCIDASQYRVYASPLSYFGVSAWSISWDPPFLYNVSNTEDLTLISYHFKYCLYGNCKTTFLLSTPFVTLTRLTRDVDHDFTIYAYSDTGALSWTERSGKQLFTERALECRTQTFFCKTRTCSRGCHGVQDCKRYSLGKGRSCWNYMSPPAITTLNIVKKGRSYMSLQWAALEEPSFSIYSYEIENLETSQKKVVMKDKYKGLKSLIFFEQFENLKRETVYGFRVRALSSFHPSAWSPVVKAKIGKYQRRQTYSRSLVPVNVKIAPVKFAESTTWEVTWSTVPEIVVKNKTFVPFYRINICGVSGCKYQTVYRSRSSLLGNLQPNSTYSYAIYVSLYSMHIRFYRFYNISQWRSQKQIFHTKYRDSCPSFSCQNVSQCIDNLKTCDGVVDCADNSDENEWANCKAPGPISLQVLKTGDEFITVQWRQLPFATVSKYEVNLRGMGVTKMFNHNTSQTHIKANFTNLVKMRNYTVQIRALNAIGWGHWSLVSAETTTRVGLPGPVENDGIVSRVAKSWKLSWTPPSILNNNDADKLKYIVKYCLVLSLKRHSCLYTKKSGHTYAVLTRLRWNELYVYTITVYSSLNKQGLKEKASYFTTRGSNSQEFRCTNGYYIALATGESYVGRYPHYKQNTFYETHEVVSFQCPSGFNFESGEKRKFSTCRNYDAWTSPWPICRGKSENVTCINEYSATEESKKHWLNPTPNRVHAIYKPHQEKYLILETIDFYCPYGTSFINSNGHALIRSQCLEAEGGSVKGRWSPEWPMCKGQVCPKLNLRNAIVNYSQPKRTAGVTAQITCWPSSHFYLWGSNSTSCEKSLRWSGNYYRECLSKTQYEKQCRKVGGNVLYHGMQDGYLLCEKQVSSALSESSHHSTNLVVGTVVPASIVFMIVLLVAVFYVQRKRARFELERGAVAMNCRNEAINLILPSYDQSEQEKPTTPPPAFEDIFEHDAESAETSMLSSERTSTSQPRGLPPAYTPREDNHAVNV